MISVDQEEAKRERQDSYMVMVCKRYDYGFLCCRSMLSFYAEIKKNEWCLSTASIGGFGIHLKFSFKHEMTVLKLNHAYLLHVQRKIINQMEHIPYETELHIFKINQPPSPTSHYFSVTVVTLNCSGL